MKIINDTLKNNGKWSRKSLTAFVFSFLGVLVGLYIVLSDWFLTKEVNRYAIDVCFAFLALGGGTLALTVIDKIRGSKRTDPE